MYLGKIVEIGPVEAIYNCPAHSYTRALLAAMPAMDPERRACKAIHRTRSTHRGTAHGAKTIHP
jgi:oligopeptide/dipeptide ABC transporter ATP-binding protein